MSVIVFGAWAGLLVGVLDLPLMLHRMGIGLGPALLFQNGLPSLSVVTHAILLWVVIGMAVSVLGRIRYRRRELPNEIEMARRQLAMTIIATGFLAWTYRLWRLIDSSAPTLHALLRIVLYSCVLWGILGVVAWQVRRSQWFRSLCMPASLAVLGLGLTGLMVGLAAWPRIVFASHRSSFSDSVSESPTPNVLLVVMDTVRADRLSTYGYPRETTPAIDALASEGRVFEKALSAAPWTVPSHATMFTGLYPSQHGAGWQHRRLDSRFTTLAERLGDSGYRTVAVTENHFLNPKMGLTQGFEEIYETNTPRFTEEPLGFAIRAALQRRLLREKPTREATRESIAVLQSWILSRRDRSQPFFAFLNLMAAHLPNYPRTDRQVSDYPKDALDRIEPVNLVPERYYLDEYRLSEPDLEIMKELYEEEIRYIDGCLGGLNRFLADLGLLDQTIVVVTSDHGESFGENELIEHQLGLYNTMLHVPLIIRYPAQIEGGTRVAWPVSTAQLPTSILELVGLSFPESDPVPESRSLFAPFGSDFLFAEYENGVEMLRWAIAEEAPEFDFSPYDRTLASVQGSGFKLIVASDGRDELYRIDDDWEELSNIIAEEPEIARELADRLAAWAKHRGESGTLEETPALDPETREALEALGYQN